VLPWILLLPFSVNGPSPEPYPAPDTPGEVQPTRWWDVEHLQLSVDIDVQAGSLTGRTEHHIEPLARSRDRLRLHQVGLHISQVTVDGAAAEFQTGQGWIEIPVAPNQAHDVVIDYTAQPELGLHFRRPGRDGATVPEIWTQGEGEDHRHWFPSWDHPTDRFTLAIDVTVPSELTAVANGELVSRQEAGQGRTTWSYRLEQPVVNYLVVLAAGEYEQVDLGPVDGVQPRIPMTSLGPVDLPDGALTAGIDRAVPMLPWFDEVLGTPYPYPVYRQVSVQGFMYGGMENASNTILAERLLVDAPYKDPRRAEAVVTHELAHQWFGDLLTCYGWRELWLNEGFASYWTNRWMEHAHGPAYAAARWHATMNAANKQPHPLALRAWSKRQDSPHSYNVYSRGSGVLRMLEIYLGRQTFDAGIQRYVHMHQNRLVETADLRRSMEDVSGEHLGWLFDGWVHRAGTPTFKVDHSMQTQGETTRTTVTISQPPSQDGTVWRAPVTIELGLADGVERHQVWVGEGQTQLVLATQERPRWVLADPERGVVARWEQELPPEQWRAILSQNTSWNARYQALTALGGTDGGADDVAALLAVAQDASIDRATRADAVGALGRRKDPAAVQALLDLTGSDSPDVRQAAVTGLGKQPPDDQLLDVVDALARRDEHAEVQAAALTALAALDGERGVGPARSMAARAPEPVQRAALTVLGDHGKPRAVRRVADGLDTREPRGTRRTAAVALWALVERHPSDDTLRERASRALEPLLDSDDVRVRLLAVRSLGAIGDEPAARRLQAFAARTRVPEHRERARDAARDIRNRKPGQVKKPQGDDLERLRERLDTLESQLEDLERRR